MENNRKNNFTLWIAILLVTAALSIWLCSIIEIIGKEFFLSTKELGVEEFWLYKGTLQMWRSAYVIVIFTATGILITSGMATMLIPQPLTIIRKVKLRKGGHAVFEEEKVTRNEGILEKPIAVKTSKRN